MLFEKITKIFNDNDDPKSRERHLKLFSKLREESSDENRISDVIAWAKNEGYLEDMDISEENAEVILQSIIVEHDLPEELRNNEQLRKELKQVAIEKAGDSSPLPPDEARRAFELIVSGEIVEDLFYSLKVIYSLIIKPDRFSNLDDSFEAYLDSLIQLPGSLIADLNPRSAFDRISNQIGLVKAGDPPDDPEILDRTLQTIFSAPEIGNTIDVISALLAPENESLRIALLVYARLNGVNLEQQDIDKVRDTILVSDDPNLGSLLGYVLIPDNSKRLAGLQPR